MAVNRQHHCPECSSNVNRRDFLQRAGTGALGLGALALARPDAGLFAAPTPDSAAETAVARFFQTLSPEQRSQICFPIDHEARARVSANWHVAKPMIHGNFYTAEQKDLIAQIFRNVTSEEGHDRFQKQMDDDSGGFDQYSVAVFGEPGQGAFEWMFTGRHLTIRADGNSTAGVAFGGPVVYGHGEEGEPQQNMFFYQTKKANEVFQALDPAQARQALLETAPRENSVPLQGASGTFSGIRVAELSADQRQLVEDVIRVILAPYRQEDIDESLKIIEQGGGLAALSMAFYKQGDLKNDRVWDIWRIEGPTFVSHFRGAPHVHAYLNIGLKS